MRQLVRTILIVCGLSLAAQTAFAKSVLHEWPVTGSSDAGTVLTAQGSAAGRGLTATIADAIPIDGRDAETIFDAEIDRQMNDEDIFKRADTLRISTGGLSMFITTIEHESGWLGDKAITIFAATKNPGDKTLRVIRADGPFDPDLMEHYTSDILAISQAPELALAEKLKLEPHTTAKRATLPKQETTPKRVQTGSTASLRTDMPPLPAGWEQKVYTDAVSYWPTRGSLARGSKTGYLSVTVYHETPLNGRSVVDALADFAKSQEQFYNVQRTEYAITDGPYRAWDYLRSKNKKGTMLNVSYLAIRTGEGKIRVVREILTDKDHKDRLSHARDLEGLYRFVEAQVESQFSAKRPASDTMNIMTRVIQTESRSQRRERQKRAKAANGQRFVASVTTRPGQGIPPKDIAGIFLRRDFLERSYKGRSPGPAVYVLLKDGTAYANPIRPPSDIDIAASRRIEAGKWLLWRKSGKGYQVRANAQAQWKQLRGRLAKPAPAKTFWFRGKHLAAWGDVLMGNAGHRTGSIFLSNKGRYETSAFVMAGGGGITGIPSATVAVSKGKGGTQSTTMGDGAPALINNTKRNPNGTDYTGQYALDGYTAEFLSDSGRLSRSLFVMLGDGSVYVGGRYYTAAK